MENKRIFLLIFVSVIFLGLRLWNLEKRINFSMDQGLFSLRAYEIWKNKEITLIGPPASPTVEGRQFFQGPLIYYSIVTLGLLSNWDPIKMGYLLCGLGLFANLILWRILKNVINEEVAWLYLILITFFPLSIKYSNFIWNPNFLLVIAPLLIGSMLKKWYFVTGLLLGLGGQYHYQFVLMWIVVILFVWFKSKKIKNIILVVAGIIIGWAPLIIFDIRNNFYNLRTILLWLQLKNSDKLVFQEYYLLYLVPILISLAAYYLSKLNNKIKVIVLIIISYWGVRSAIILNKKWTYSDLVETRNIIENQTDNKFNIVNLSDGDSRFYSLRYLLNLSNKKPESVENYKNIDALYVLVKKEEELKIKNSNLWEIREFNGEISQMWPINSYFNLFLIKK